MSHYDAVLFDLDGTLLDSIALILASYRHTLEAAELPVPTDADMLSGLGTTLEDQFGRWVADPARVSELVARYIEHNLEIHDEHVRPYPGVNEIVRALHSAGTPLAIVTSKRRRGARMGVAALGLEGCFSAMVCGDDVERPKPDPEPVRRALDALGVRENVAFVGDAIHDVHSGRDAGVFTIAVSWGAGSRNEFDAADIVVDDADALRRALLGP